jgi:hypothetical protein
MVNYRVSSAATTGLTTNSSILQQTTKNFKQEHDLTKAQEKPSTDRKKFKKKKKLIQKLAKNTDVIRLNVGGEFIMTTRETLTRVPKSTLAIMFNDRWRNKLAHDEQGNIVFDFDPILFRHLLDQLQMSDKNNPIVFHPPSIPALVKPFNKMLRKLGLNQSVSSKDSVITLNVGGQIVTNRQKTLNRLSNKNFLDNILSLKNKNKVATNDTIFLDHDPELFQQLINYLRDESTKNICSLIPPSSKKYNAFKRLLIDLGVNSK